MCNSFQALTLLVVSSVTVACSSVGPLEIERPKQIVSKIQEPKLCVALSGGGLRSAATSVGVLQSLNQSVGLENVDLISSTSGGAWAQLWLHAQLARGQSIDEVLGETGSQPTKDMERLEKAPFMDFLGKSAMLIGARTSYFALINNKFSLTENSWPHNLQIAEVQQNVLARNAPVPIFILSTFSRCAKGDDTIIKFGKEGQKLKDRLLEFMPIHDHMIELNPVEWGSEKFGYSSVFPFHIRSVVDWAVTASAATDAPGFRHCPLIRAAALSTGSKVTTPRETKANSFFGEETIFIADGGFVDNLALEVLVDRGCESILVVDAEQDNGLVFEGYQRVRNDLHLQGKNLVVPEVESWIASQQGILCQGKQATDGCFLTRDESNPIVRNPVMTGCITTADSCVAKLESIRVQYLKLTLDPASVNAGRMSPEVVDLYNGVLNQPTCKTLTFDSSDECKFPHTPTLNAQYSETLFRAHRLLGYDLMQLHFDKGAYMGSFTAQLHSMP